MGTFFLLIPITCAINLLIAYVEILFSFFTITIPAAYILHHVLIKSAFALTDLSSTRRNMYAAGNGHDVCTRGTFILQVSFCVSFYVRKSEEHFSSSVRHRFIAP